MTTYVLAKRPRCKAPALTIAPKSIPLLGLTLLTLAVFTLDLEATTYYVRKDGNNSNNGLSDSSEGAWLTIQKAANEMVDGDTAILGPGTYSERVTSSTDGSPGSPITFSGNRDATFVGAWYITHSHIVIDGCTVNGSTVTGLQGGITLATGGNNNIVRNVLIKDVPVYGYYHIKAVTNCLLERSRIENPSSHGITLYGSGHTVRKNYFHSRQGADVMRVVASTSTIADNFIDNWGNPVRTNGTLRTGNRYQWFDVSGNPDFSNVGAGTGPYALNTTFTATGSTPISWGTATAKVQNSNHTDLYQSFSVNAIVTSQFVIVERNLHINCDGAQIGNFEDQASAAPFYKKNVSDWTFRNNIFIDVSSQMNGYIEDFHWYNNTFARSSYLITGAVLFFNYSGLPDDPGMKGNSHGAKVFNNIFYECGRVPQNRARGWYAMIAGNTGTEADYNLVVGPPTLQNPNITSSPLERGITYRWFDVSGNPDFSNVGAGPGPYTVDLDDPKSQFTATGTTPISWGSSTATVRNARGTKAFEETNGKNGADPLFVNEAKFTGSPRELTGWDGIDQAKVRALAARFKLTTLSPAKDTGLQSNALFTDDYEGAARGASWNMGAFDSTSSADLTAPAAPTDFLLLP